MRLACMAVAFPPTNRPSTAYSCAVVDRLSESDADARQNPAKNVAAPIVFVATPMAGGMATGEYIAALAQTAIICLRNGLGVLYMYRQNDSIIASARNHLAHQFLESQATHLMWIDADIGFNPIDIVSMVIADQDIVCGVYPKKGIDWRRVAQAVRDGVPSEELKSHVGSFVVHLTDDITENNSADDLAKSDGLVEIAAGGTGFMMIKRGVFEALSDEVPEYLVAGTRLKEFYANDIDAESSQFVSEDYYFCRLARSHGFKVYAAPWIHLTHTGTYVFDSQLQPNWVELNTQR